MLCTLVVDFGVLLEREAIIAVDTSIVVIGAATGIRVRVGATRRAHEANDKDKLSPHWTVKRRVGCEHSWCTSIPCSMLVRKQQYGAVW